VNLKELPCLTSRLHLSSPLLIVLIAMRLLILIGSLSSMLMEACKSQKPMRLSALTAANFLIGLSLHLLLKVRRALEK